MINVPTLLRLSWLVNEPLRRLDDEAGCRSSHSRSRITVPRTSCWRWGWRGGSPSKNRPCPGATDAHHSYRAWSLECADDAFSPPTAAHGQPGTMSSASLRRSISGPSPQTSREASCQARAAAVHQDGTHARKPHEELITTGRRHPARQRTRPRRHRSLHSSDVGGHRAEDNGNYVGRPQGFQGRHLQEQARFLPRLVGF